MYYYFSYELCLNEINSTKRTLRIQYGLLVFNIVVAVMNGTLAYYGTGHITNSISLGAMLINTFWTLVYIIEYHRDLTMDKERLCHLEKYRDDKNLQEAIKQHQRSEEFYKQACENLLADDKKKKSEDIRKGDSGLQPGIAASNRS